MVDLEDVKNYQTSLNGASDSGSGLSVTSSEEPATLTFAQLKELIEQGKTDQIPNNRTIPNELHVGSSLPLLPSQYAGNSFG